MILDISDDLKRCEAEVMILRSDAEIRNIVVPSTERSWSKKNYFEEET